MRQTKSELSFPTTGFTFTTTGFTLLHCNVQGFTSHKVQLLAHLQLSNWPTFVALNETFLDQSTENLTLEGYTLVSRRDRVNRKGGGIALFVLDSAADCVTLLEHSEEDERTWHRVHTTQGPLLLGVWYRPPAPGEVASIERLEQEWLKHSDAVLGTLLVGDLNVHHTTWLKHSSSVSREGSALYNFCTTFGLEERVRKPTRGNNLLDLVLTDMHTDVQCTVQPQLADHRMVLATVQLEVPKVVEVPRECWVWSKANWGALKDELGKTNWDNLLFLGEEAFDDLAEEAVRRFTTHVLEVARKHVPVHLRNVKKSTHPWLNQTCLTLVQKARAAENTPEHAERLRECSEGVLAEFHKYVARTKERLKQLPKSSKAWWKLTKNLQNKAEKNSSVPALKREDGTWAQEALEKAELLQRTFSKKYTLPPECVPEVQTWADTNEGVLGDFLPVRVRDAVRVLKNLNEEKTTGPDSLSARLLKRCAAELGRPVALLTRLLLNTGRWPKLWRLHWVYPLYKKRSVYDPNNYRGIHLSSQLSKVVERLLGRFFLPFLEVTGAYGPNQWAYRRLRGCKDALAYNAVQWVWQLHCGNKVGLYCSDVSGAFDRVRSERLLQKLASLGVRGRLLRLLASWLDYRDAVVVVNGARSEPVELHNQVYQGTVWGPPLWNCYFADARHVAETEGYDDTFFADDLNLYKAFPTETHNDAVLHNLDECQAALHEWGTHNQVLFDAGKESKHVLHRRQPAGDSFRILGVLWDTKLTMAQACQEVAQRAGWKLRTLLRTKRYYDTSELVKLFKCHVLPVLEFPTPAVYHAATTLLDSLDRVQRRFLREVGLSEEEALLNHNLAPLNSRRDMAALGLIHRTVLGLGPPHFRTWFFPATTAPHNYATRRQTQRHNKQLHDYLQGNHTELLRRSLLGQVRVYNSLSQSTVDANSVSLFQHRLQCELKDAAANHKPQWSRSLAARLR